MYNRIGMAVLECTGDLTGKLPCSSLAESAMGNDVVEHLTTVDPLADHVVVVGIDMHGFHTANVRMVEEELDGGFPNGAHFLREILSTGLLHFLRRGLRYRQWGVRMVLGGGCVGMGHFGGSSGFGPLLALSMALLHKVLLQG